MLMKFKEQCEKKSRDGYSCQLDKGHGGPCSRVLWRGSGRHQRVYWWPGGKASETLDMLNTNFEVW